MLNLFAASIISAPSVVEKQFLDRKEIKQYKIIVSFCSKIAKHLYQPEMFNGRRILAHLYSLHLNEGLRASPRLLAILGIYYQNKPFLGMFQLKFCLNSFETCLLLFVCILKFSILAIILFKYLLLDPSVKSGPNCPGG